MKTLIKEQQLEEGIHAKEEYQHGLEVDVKIYNQESYGEEKHPHEIGRASCRERVLCSV